MSKSTRPAPLSGANSKGVVIADALFVGQLLVMLWFYGSRIHRAFETVRGVNLAEQFSIEVFCLLNLALAVASYRSLPSRVAKQIVVIHIINAVATAGLGIIWITQGYVWSGNDILTACLAVGGSLVTITVGQVYGLPLIDPIIKGWIAVACKAIPHLMLGLKIADEGRDGFPLAALVMGHLLILLRLLQIAIAVRQANAWDRNRIGAAISDGAGEIAWLFVTVMWLTH